MTHPRYALATFLAVALLTAAMSGCSGAGSSSTNSGGSSVSAQTKTLTITSGGTYSGIWTSSDPSVPAVQILTDQPVILENSTVSGPGDLIVAEGSSAANLTVRNVTGTALDPKVAGKARGSFVNATGMGSLVVKNCTINGASFGIYLEKSTVTTLQISNNVATNLEDRASDGNGGLEATRPRLGHFVEIAGVTAPNGADIGWNQDKQTVGSTSIEGGVEIYLSQGTAGSPILVHDNYMEGGSSTTTAIYTGSGVTANGDMSGNTAYILFKANEIVHTAGEGVAIVNGHDISATGNRVVSCGVDTAGKVYTRLGVTAVTLWNFYNAPDFYNNTITTTEGGLVAVNSTGQLATGDINMVTTGATLDTSGNSFTDPCFVAGQINVAAEDAERSFWAAKLKANSIVLGDQH